LIKNIKIDSCPSILFIQEPKHKMCRMTIELMGEIRTNIMIKLMGENYKSVRDLCYKNWTCKELRDNLRESCEAQFIKGIWKWNKDKLISESEKNADMVLIGGMWNVIWNDLCKDKFETAGMSYQRIYDANKIFDENIWKPYLKDVLEEEKFEVIKNITIEFAEGVLEKFAKKEEEEEDEEDDEEDDEDDEDDEEDDEDEDELWNANLMKGDEYSRLMKQAMDLYPNDREACISYLSVKSCGTFNGLVRNF
jgi:hypothetical protein